MQRYRLSIIGFFFWALSLKAQIPMYYSQLDLSGKEESLILQLADKMWSFFIGGSVIIN